MENIAPDDDLLDIDEVPGHCAIFLCRVTVLK
jgi:hypothetical protein